MHRRYNPSVCTRVLTLSWCEISRQARSVIGASVFAMLAACTPQQQLLMSLVPDGTFPILLSHLENTSDANRRRVAELDARGDWNGLVQFAEENLVRDRSNTGWWLVKGYAYSRLGQSERAAECYAELVRLEPDNMLGWNLLAQSQRATGQTQRAVQTLSNALLIRQDSAATWFLLGESYTELGRYQPAEKAYQQAVQLNRGFVQAWYGLGRVYARQGRQADFEDIVRTLARLDPPLAQRLANEARGREAPRTP